MFSEKKKKKPFPGNMIKLRFSALSAFPIEKQEQQMRMLEFQ